MAHRMHRTALALGLAGIALGAQEDRPEDSPAPSLAEAREIAAPDEADLAWRDIAWRPDLSTAIRDAHGTDTPIVLWLMNGNPAGFC